MCVCVWGGASVLCVCFFSDVSCVCVAGAGQRSGQQAERRPGEAEEDQSPPGSQALLGVRDLQPSRPPPPWRSNSTMINRHGSLINHVGVVSCSLRVRGQHTKTTGRRGRTVGVSKKK